MSNPGVNFPLSTSEAWELVGYLATSGSPELIAMSNRLENQLIEIELIKKKLEELKAEFFKENGKVRK